MKRMNAVQRAGSLSPQAIVQAVCGVRPCQVILVEGGPRLLGDFFAGQLLDEGPEFLADPTTGFQRQMILRQSCQERAAFTALVQFVQ